MANTLGVISTVGFVGCVLLVVAAAMLFFMLDIRAVRDEMLGRTAERTIAEMRQTTWATRRNRERSARRLTRTDADSPIGEGSGSLHIRTITAQETGQPHSAGDVSAAQDEAMTTLLDAGEADESKTALLPADGPDKADEAVTTLLTDGEG